MPGRSRLDPSRPPLTGAERSRRFRALHPKPPPPKEEPGPPVLRTFSEIAASLLPEPPKPPERPPFDPAALISVADAVLPTPDPGFGFMK